MRPLFVTVFGGTVDSKSISLSIITTASRVSTSTRLSFGKAMIMRRMWKRIEGVERRQFVAR